MKIAPVTTSVLIRSLVINADASTISGPVRCSDLMWIPAAFSTVGTTHGIAFKEFIVSD